MSHDFDYHFNSGDKVCYNCGLIDYESTPITLPDNMHFKTKSNYSYKAYLKKCILIHENLNNKIFQRSFHWMFPNELKISVRYILLYGLVIFYDHPCLESTFINIKINKTKNAMSLFVIKFSQS